MATNRNSPTAGEIDTPDVPRDVPEVDGDKNPDLAAQYPPASDEVPEPPVGAHEPYEDPAAEPGSVWAFYNGNTIHERGLTPKDQMEAIGVPASKVFNSGDDRLGAWWTPGNRHRLNVTDAHPLLIRYLEKEDPDFTIERY